MYEPGFVDTKLVSIRLPIFFPKPLSVVKGALMDLGRRNHTYGIFIHEVLNEIMVFFVKYAPNVVALVMS